MNDKAVRPSITIVVLLTMLQSFGQALGGATAWLVGRYYSLPVPEQLADWFTVIVTVPLQLAAIWLAIKQGWVKIE